MALFVPIFNNTPVNDLPEGLQVGGSAILVVQVVGVFPDIEC